MPPSGSTSGVLPGASSGAATSGPGHTTAVQTGSSGASSTDGGVSFILPDPGCVLPDGVLGHCTVPPCSLAHQDCPEGQSCTPFANDGGSAWNAARCGPVDDAPDQLGESCTVISSALSGISSCDVGLMCWNVDADTLQGTCAELCDPEGDCTLEANTCRVFNDGFLPVCLPSCDPLAPECDEGFACYPTLEQDFACLREGERVHVDDIFHPDCPAGTFWASAERVDGCTAEEPCCVEYCDLSGPPSCDLDEACTAFSSEPPPIHEDLGYCQPGT